MLIGHLSAMCHSFIEVVLQSSVIMHSNSCCLSNAYCAPSVILSTHTHIHRPSTLHYLNNYSPSKVAGRRYILQMNRLSFREG